MFQDMLECNRFYFTNSSKKMEPPKGVEVFGFYEILWGGFENPFKDYKQLISQ